MKIFIEMYSTQPIVIADAERQKGRKILHTCTVYISLVKAKICQKPPSLVVTRWDYISA